MVPSLAVPDGASEEEASQKKRAENLVIFVCVMCIYNIYIYIPSWELTYPLFKSILKMTFLFPFGWICDRSLGGYSFYVFIIRLSSYRVKQ